MSGFSEKLKSVRLEAGLTQEMMGTALDVSGRTYKHYELGQRSPSIEFLQRVVERFQVDAGWLIENTEEWANRFDYFVEVFSAFDAAREAYIRFEKRGVSWSQATDNELKELRAAGKRLADIGEAKCMGAAIRAMFPDDPGRTLRAGDELNHLWSGIDGWRA